MPNTNDFKPFAIGAGANVIDQATYLALAALASGFANGIADPAQLNKVWRQSAFVSSALAQLMSDSLAADILDDGNIAEFEGNLAAVLRGAVDYVADTGVANVYLVAPTPAPTAYTSGQMWTILAAHDNTGAATVNVAGLGVKSIVRPDGSALQGGEILGGNVFSIVYNATSGKFQLVAANVRPGFSKIQTFNAAGTFSFVVPAGVYLLDVEGWGGGGGGSGNPTGVLGQCGGGGAYGRKLIAVTPGQTITVTIPAAAAGGVAGANSGANGGTCSFGAFMSIAGGAGGVTSTGAGTGGGAAPTGVDIAMPGGPSAAISVSGQSYGVGGSAPRGGQGGFITNSGAQAGNWPGGGGGSGVNGAAPEPGGPGAVGGFVVRW